MSIGFGVGLAPLPSMYAEIPCTCDAVDVPLQVNVLGLVKLNFKGEIRVRVEAALPPSLSLGGVLGGVHLRVIGHEVSADSPVLGRVTISRREIST